MCVAEEKMAGGSSSVAHRKAALGTSTGWLASVDKVGMGMEMVVVHVCQVGGRAHDALLPQLQQCQPRPAV